MSKYIKTDVAIGGTVNSDVNVQLGLIESSIGDTLSLSGGAGNSMTSDLDMNSNDILNASSVTTTVLTVNGVLVTPDASGIDLSIGYAWTGSHTWSQNATFNSNIIVTGLVDGRDIAADGTQLDLTFDPTNINEALVPINTQTGTTYTTVLGDAGTMVTLNNASSIVCTIPPNSSVAYPIGTTMQFTQVGAGVVTLTAGGGVTLNSLNGLVMQGADSVARAVKTAEDIWYIEGTGLASSASSLITSKAMGTGNYTLVASDHGKILVKTGASATTLTTPQSLGPGFWCYVFNNGSNSCTFTAAGGTSIESIGSTPNAPVLPVNGGRAKVITRSTDTFTIAGDIT